MRRVLVLRGFLERIQLAARVAAERRLRVLVDETRECLPRICRLAGFQIGATELHQDAVDRQRTVFALRHVLEGVDRLLVLTLTRLRFRETETRHLPVDAAAARAIDDVRSEEHTS